MGADITALPQLDEDKCIGCYTCIAVCPGQAIFVVDESLEGDDATVAMPYEFLPLPEKGEKVTALDRSGAELGEAEVGAGENRQEDGPDRHGHHKGAQEMDHDGQGS